MKRTPSQTTRLLALLILTASIPAGLAQSLPYNITNVSEQKAEGEALVTELLAQKPVESFAQTARLKIRDGAGKRSELQIRFSTTVTPTNWTATYFAATEHDGVLQMNVMQSPDQPGQYRYGQTTAPNVSALPLSAISLESATQAFGGSDFAFIDLGLEFFHWPEQRLIRKKITRTRSCRVLESVNPQPAAGGYSKVRTWIDRETAGIVFAEAYDAKGKLLKEFSPKGVKKVNGQWQLQEMEMRNVQAGSRSLIVFDPATGQ